MQSVGETTTYFRSGIVTGRDGIVPSGLDLIKREKNAFQLENFF